MTLLDGPPKTLRLEGALTTRSVPEFESACREAATLGALCLDLSGLRFVDAAGVASLRLLLAQGRPITGKSNFVKELIDTKETTT